MHVTTSLYVTKCTFLFTEIHKDSDPNTNRHEGESQNMSRVIAIDTGRRKANSSFNRSSVRGIYCWSVQKGKVLHLKRSF